MCGRLKCTTSREYHLFDLMILLYVFNVHAKASTFDLYQLNINKMSSMDFRALEITQNA